MEGQQREQWCSGLDGPRGHRGSTWTTHGMAQAAVDAQTRLLHNTAPGRRGLQWFAGSLGSSAHSRLPDARKGPGWAQGGAALVPRASAPAQRRQADRDADVLLLLLGCVGAGSAVSAGRDGWNLAAIREFSPLCCCDAGVIHTPQIIFFLEQTPGGLRIK